MKYHEAYFLYYLVLFIDSVIFIVIIKKFDELKLEIKIWE